MVQPQNTIGYCAVIAPELDHWQAYYIIDAPAFRTAAAQMKLLSLGMATMANPFGAIQATLAEGALKNDEGVVGAAALALHKEERPYFYIIAEKRIHDTKTSLHAIEASSVDEARDKINNLPEVLAIKKRLTAKMTTRDGQGQRRAFH